MTVYVDDVRHVYGQMIMCHMWADSLDELLHMADKIGLRRKWLQQPPKASWIHFDVSLGKKNLAIRLGAVLTDKYGPVEHTTRLSLEVARDPRTVAYFEKKLKSIEALRARRNDADRAS